MSAPLIPFINMKYTNAVKAIPPNNAPTQVAFFSKWNDNNILEMYCTKAPIEKATNTESNIPPIICFAFSVFM